jgi:hypothetical protein
MDFHLTFGNLAGERARSTAESFDNVRQTAQQFAAEVRPAFDPRTDEQFAADVRTGFVPSCP